MVLLDYVLTNIHCHTFSNDQISRLKVELLHMSVHSMCLTRVLQNKIIYFLKYMHSFNETHEGSLCN